MTSLTLTETARMPCGNRRRQAGARLERRELGFGQRLVGGDRVDQAAVERRSRWSVKPLVTGLLAGQATSLTWSLVISVPIGMSIAATT